VRDRLYKRNGVWWCRVRNAAGRMVRKSTRCRDYEAAVIAYGELERASASQDHARAEETTLERCVNDYLADLVRRGRSKATIAIAQQKTGHLLRLWGKHFRMGRITARLVNEYVDARIREGVKRFTVKKELGHLGQVLVLARYHRLFHMAVELILPPFFSGGHKPKTRWPTPAELEAVLLQLAPHRAAHVAFIVATGARKSEAEKAHRSDVDWARGVVRVRGTKTETADDEVPITSLTERYLRAALENAPGKERLFLAWGKYHRDIHAACVRAGVDSFSPNDLRRAFGKWHRAAGVSVELVSKMLRHTTDKLAQTTYARLDGAQVSALVNQQIQIVPTVYQTGAQDTPKALPMLEGETMNAGKTKLFVGAPGRTRNAGLRFRKPSDERRSLGTKLGVYRSRLARVVPDVYGRDPPPWPHGPHREFRIVGSEVRRLDRHRDPWPDAGGWRVP